MLMIKRFQMCFDLESDRLRQVYFPKTIYTRTHCYLHTYVCGENWPGAQLRSDLTTTRRHRNDVDVDGGDDSSLLFFALSFFDEHLSRNAEYARKKVNSLEAIVINNS